MCQLGRTNLSTANRGVLEREQKLRWFGYVERMDEELQRRQKLLYLMAQRMAD